MGLQRITCKILKIDGIEIQEPASLADILADVQQQVQNQGQWFVFNIFKSRLSLFFNGLFGGSPSTVNNQNCKNIYTLI